MTRTRAFLAKVALAVVSTLIVVVATVNGVLSHDGERPAFVGPQAIEGWRSAHAFFYIVPVPGGVLLFDTGFDDDGDTLERALDGRKVLGVFLTHAHVDHWAGAWRLGEIPVFVSVDDRPRVLGEEDNEALLPWLGDQVMPRQRPPPKLVDIDEGTMIGPAAVRSRGDWLVLARALPGHTPGSLVYEVHLESGQRKLLFAGDALMGSSSGVVVTSPGLFSDDVELAQRSVKVLEGWDPEAMFDGHGGRTLEPGPMIEAFLVAHGLK